MITDFVNNGSWDENKLRALDQSVVAMVKEAGVCFSNNADSLVWPPTSDGVFSLKSAWELVRPHANPNPIAQAIEYLECAPKLKVFSWKIMHSIVVTDEKVQGMGIFLASKWVSCGNASETMFHMLISGRIASVVWNFFSNLFGARIFPSESPIIRFYRLYR